MSYATVWRVADRNDIELKAGREAKRYKRHPAEVWAKVENEVAANPDATQEQLAPANRRQPLDRRPGGARAPRRPRINSMTRNFGNRGSRQTGMAYCVRRSRDGCAVIELHPDHREAIVASGLALTQIGTGWRTLSAFAAGAGAG